MPINSPAADYLEGEARALLTRLARVRPFALEIPSVLAAAATPAAQTAIEGHMAKGRQRLKSMVFDYLRWLRGPQALASAPAEIQARFSVLRLRFNAMLTQFDIFADALVQRTEHDNGVRLAGLDVVAADALQIPGAPYEAPPVICYLDRGHGAAIRRARTRLPGGGENPVAIIRVPRERMIGSGIGSSLVHEVGHQATALIELISSLRPTLQALQHQESAEKIAWTYYERCLSEIVADFWAMAKLGISATTGLIGVVSLPRAFVFRIAMDDPHPFPWIRVRLSTAMGRALFPHPQWARLEQLWDSFYPLDGLDAPRRKIVDVLLRTLPAFAGLLANHRPRLLHGRTMAEALEVDERQPARLIQLYKQWGGAPTIMRNAGPSLVFAVIGQARADGTINPEEESRLLTNLLTYWALRGTLDTSAYCTQSLRATTHAPRSSTLTTIQV